MSPGAINGRDFLFYSNKCTVFHFLCFGSMGVSYLTAFNSFHAMAVNKRPLLGVHFFRGHISLKNWTICPPFSHDTSSFKDTCLLTYIIEAKVALYVLNGQPNMPVPTYLMKRTVERQLGIESDSCKS
jgi:hypothetical protein